MKSKDDIETMIDEVFEKDKINISVSMIIDGYTITVSKEIFENYDYLREQARRDVIDKLHEIALKSF